MAPGVEPSDNATSSNDLGRSMLAFYLCQQVMWGFISTEMARTIAENAWQDGLQHKELDKLRKIGTQGMHKQNLWRDMRANMCVPPIERAVVAVDVPVKGRGTTRLNKLQLTG